MVPNSRLGAALLIDPNLIAETIRKYFSVQLRPLDKHVYRKLYPEWVDKNGASN